MGCFSLLISVVLLAHHLRAANAAFNVSTIPFSKGFTTLFGDDNIRRSSDDRTVDLLLDHHTGSGFRSSDLYSSGFFSAKIKLPSDYTAGIVVAFYTTNGGVFEKTHDELDFEFLGNVRGKAWRFQTNVYGNGSTNRGREERYYLWFDPSLEFHQYSILWTPNNIIFFIDEIPIREVAWSKEMGGDYPSKPMSLYATIWDASTWATSGGKYKVNYKYAPFVAQFTDLVLHGSPVNPIQELLSTTPSHHHNNHHHHHQMHSSLESMSMVSQKQRMGMKSYRQKFMYYSYCYDTLRYPIPPPECVVDPLEKERFKETGRLRFDERKRQRHSKKKPYKS